MTTGDEKTIKDSEFKRDEWFLDEDEEENDFTEFDQTDKNSDYPIISAKYRGEKNKNGQPHG